MGPSPKPPRPGGEHIQFIDTGPQAVSPNATRVNLIPVGDGGPGRPLPLRRRRKPATILPSRRELERLPRWARVAFAARCARRVLPIYPAAAWVAEHHLELQRVVAEIERTAANASGDVYANYAAVAADDDLDAAYGSNPALGAIADTAVAVADTAVAAAFVAVADTASATYHAVERACQAMLRICTSPWELTFIRRDFERVARLARRNGWTDDTPVPPEAFGPLWPPGREPGWAREKREPQG